MVACGTGRGGVRRGAAGRPAISIAMLAAGLGPLAAAPAAASSFSIIYNYLAAADNGPWGGVTVGPDGTLYSATAGGGPEGGGAIFKLVRPANPTAQWPRPLLHIFTGQKDGGEPIGAPVLAPSGLLYGTSNGGGNSGYGAVYQVDPKVGVSSYKVIYSFTGGQDGGFPWGGVVIDGKGAVYATASLEGKGSYGTVIKLAPGAGGGWTETTLHAFSGNDGETPEGDLYMDAAGAVYGTTWSGGTYGAGVVFRLAPPAAGQSGWSFTRVHSFTGNGDGGTLVAGLTADRNGRLFGTTSQGGGNGGGTVFRLTSPAAPSATWSFRTVFTFGSTASAGGGEPYCGVAIDAKGVIYGTTESGGKNYSGVLFKLTPSAANPDHYAETVLHSFDEDFAYGDTPRGRLAIGPDGAVYGSTEGGGTGGGGTVFRYAP